LAFCVAALGQMRSSGGCPSSSTPAIQNQYRSGVAALEQNKFLMARHQFELLVKQLPQCAELHDLLGYALLRQADLKQAIREFETAVRLKPDFQLALIHWAETLASNGQSLAAVAKFRQA